MGRAFHHEQNPMLTVERDDSPSVYDMEKARSREYYAAHKGKRIPPENPQFVQNPKWKRCFAGLDEMNQKGIEQP